MPCFLTGEKMIEIIPVPAVYATITVPGSKSLTQRALVVAALANGESTLTGALESEDTIYTAKALMQMGVKITKNGNWQITGNSGRIMASEQSVFLGNNGTATRFLASVASLGSSLYLLDGDSRMRQRPIGPLLAALGGWGGDAHSVRGTGCPPLRINGTGKSGLAGGETVLAESRSSQYLSSLLLVAPYTKKPATLRVKGKIPSRPYVAMTLAVMNDFGIKVCCAEDYSWFQIPQGCYQARKYCLEGDASNASYFWAAAAVCGGRVVVENVPVPSLQGDAMLAALLGRMGCHIERSGRGIAVSGTGQLRGIAIDMEDMPDVVPTLAVVAAFAEGVTTIDNIGHLRIKECDRLSAVVRELRKLGVVVEEFDHSMRIHGAGNDLSCLHGAEIKTYNDHRMAMSFSVAGLKIPGVKIEGEDCVAKSFPDYWQKFSLLKERSPGGER